MSKMSSQKFKYLENEESFYDEIKSIFHHFQRAFNEANKTILEGESPVNFAGTNFRDGHKNFRFCDYLRFHDFLPNFHFAIIKIFEERKKKFFDRVKITVPSLMFLHFSRLEH